MALTDLTDDILLHILSTFLDLSDTFSLLSTCKSLQSLSSYKHLWLTALTHESKHRALSCALSLNIYSPTTTASHLRQIALNTQKLKANWTSATPRTTGPLLQYKYAEFDELDGTGGEILTVIPNTRVAVIFCAGNILCRDLRRPSQPLATNSIYIGGYYSWYTYEYRPGELYVGLITSQSEELSMVRIKFTPLSCSPPELLWKTALTVECKSLFILEDAVGFISHYHLSRMTLKLIDLNDSSRSKEVVLELPEGNFSFADYKSCWVQNNNLYLHLQITSSNHEIYRIEFDRTLPSPSSLSSLSSHSSHSEKAKMVLVMNDKWTLDNNPYPSSWTPWLKMSMRGLQSAQVLSTPDESVAKPKLTRLTFWPLRYHSSNENGKEEEGGIYLKEGLKRSQLEIPGEITYFDHDESGYLTFRSYSGTYAVMIIATPQRWPTSTSHLSLYLFHFDSETGGIPYRKLHVPERICLEDIFSISIEERSGMVYLVDVRGWLFGLQFGFDKDKEGEGRDGGLREGMECLSVGEVGYVGMRRVESTSGN